MTKIYFFLLYTVCQFCHAEETFDASMADVSPSGLSGEFIILPNNKNEVVSTDSDSISSHSDMVQTDASQGGDFSGNDGAGNPDDFIDNSKKKDKEKDDDALGWWTEASIKYNFAYLNSFNTL